jgi:hypothetical protein
VEIRKKQRRKTEEKDNGIMCIMWQAIKEGRKLRKYVASRIYRKERAHRMEDIVNERTRVPKRGACSDKSISSS